MTKKVVIIGAGQDGSYMAEYVLEHTEHQVVVAVRRTSRDNLDNLSQVVKNPRAKVVTADLTDAHSITALIREEKPDYLINLGGATFVPDSFNSPAQVLEVNAISLVHILEAVREFAPQCRVFSAGSSTQADGKSIYAVSKIAAGALCKVYREKYGLYVVHAIMYNHCSPRQSECFLPAKIAKGVARIARAIKDGKPFEPIELGNLDAQMDLSWAPDFCDGIWRMLNQETPYRSDVSGTLSPLGRVERIDYQFPREYTLCSGELHSVREFVERGFETGGWQNLRWTKTGVAIDEYMKGVAYIDYQGALCSQTHTLVRINPAFYRPAETTTPGDSSAIRRELGWSPQTSFDQLVRHMVRHEMELAGV